LPKVPIALPNPAGVISRHRHESWKIQYPGGPMLGLGAKPGKFQFPVVPIRGAPQKTTATNSKLDITWRQVTPVYGWPPAGVFFVQNNPLPSASPRQGALTLNIKRILENVLLISTVLGSYADTTNRSEPHAQLQCPEDVQEKQQC